MANYKVKVLDVKPVTHNVNAFTIEKPEGFTYVPGQATDLSIIKENWENEKRRLHSLPYPEAIFSNLH